MNWSELTKRSAFLLSFIITTIFISCESPKDIGLTTQQNPNDVIGVSFDDNFDLQPKTVLLDSMITSNNLVALVGKYSDPIFGDITSQAFLNMRPAVSAFVEDSSRIVLSGTNQSFQNLKLRLNISYSYGIDITKDKTPQTINIYELRDTLVTRSYINSETVPFNDTRLLGTVTFVPQDVIDQNNGILEVTIDDTDYQQRIFNVAIAQGKTEDFLSSVKGLAIVPANTNTAMIGFSRSPLSSTALTMGYSAENDEGVLTDFEFSMLFLENAFNNIVVENRPGALANLSSNNKELDTGDILYAQAGTGIVTRLDFVDVLRLKSLGTISINKAELVISPVLETVADENITIPSHLLLTQANGFLIERASTGGFNFLANEEAPGLDRYQSNLTQYSESFKYYTYNITGQLQEMLNGTRGTQVFVMSSFATQIGNVGGVIGGSRVNRIMIDNAPTSNRKIQLRVFYTLIKQ